ncbi:MAG TPA: hypothetical protein VN723_02300 [Rhizomicrobium sp.]|jgi:hypothetical protein|nr:hypothetical protein [Rhizomicrobium sp.]
MKKFVALVWSLSLLAASSAPSAASDASEVAAVVKKWVGDFNKGNLKAFVAGCAPNAAVVDGFPPYAWTDCASWINDYVANNKAIQATGGTLTIGKPLFFDASGGRAYATYPATFSDVQKGKPVVYKGNWAITLQKISGAWIITGSGSAWTID